MFVRPFSIGTIHRISLTRFLVFSFIVPQSIRGDTDTALDPDRAENRVVGTPRCHTVSDILARYPAKI